MALVKIRGLTRTQYLSIPHLSDFQLRCMELLLIIIITNNRCVALLSHDGVNRDVRIPQFFPAFHPASAIMFPSPIILYLHLPKKLSDMRSIRARVRVSTSVWFLRHNPVTEPLWSDYNSDTLCTVSDFMAAYLEGRSLTRHDIETAVACTSL